jgi:hypothetical protein
MKFMSGNAIFTPRRLSQAVTGRCDIQTGVFPGQLIDIYRKLPNCGGGKLSLPVAAVGPLAYFARPRSKAPP